MRRKIVYVVIALLIAGGGFLLYDYGYSEGYDSGYAAGNDDGYDRGYENAKDNFYTEPTDEQAAALEQATEYLEGNDYGLPVSDAPAGTVFVTRTGDKYHEGWCHYISDKRDLTGYESAADAEWAGYTPCSVCH